MSHPPRPARPLPAAPDLEQQKKQAKGLLRAARQRDPEALRRLRENHPRLSALPDADGPRRSSRCTTRSSSSRGSTVSPAGRS